MAGFDGNGTYVRPYNWTNDAANGLPIDATKFDTDGNDVASAFDLCLTRDNQGKPTAPLTWTQPLSVSNLTVSGGTVDTNALILSDAGAKIAITRSSGGGTFVIGSDSVGGSALSILNNGGTTSEIQLTGTSVLLRTNSLTRQTISGAGVFSIPAATGGVSTFTLASDKPLTSGGYLGTGINFTNVANFGVYVGVGVPAINAAKGSLYLRSDGSSSSTRLYSASDSSGTWVAVTTAS